MLLKHNKDGGINNVVHAAVEEVFVSAVFGRRPAVARGAFGVASHQHLGDKHGFDVSVARVSVRVFGVPGKVTSWVEKERKK